VTILIYLYELLLSAPHLSQFTVNHLRKSSVQKPFYFFSLDSEPCDDFGVIRRKSDKNAAITNRDSNPFYRHSVHQMSDEPSGIIIFHV